MDLESTGLEVRIKWDESSDDFNLDVYEGWFEKDKTPDDQLVGFSAARTGVAERVTVPDAEPGKYTIRVVYARVAEASYRGVASSMRGIAEQPPAERRSYTGLPDDPLVGHQWALEKIGAPEAWELPSATGHGITIGVVDTGVDLGHPDLSCPGKLLVLFGSRIQTSGPPDDEDGHGTHVAGIAAACTNNGTGVAGVAPDATVMPVNVMEADTSLEPGGFDDAMAAGIRFATDNGAHVVNLSIGPPAGESALLEVHDQTRAALQAAYEAGVVVVAAAGNNSFPVCEFPALSRYVICVAATDREDRKTAYSSFPNNDDPDDDRAVGLVAPGGDLVPHGTGSPEEARCAARILSTYLQGEPSSCPAFGDGYAGLVGTSQAAPHVAGVAALVYDRLGGERSETNAQDVIDAIKDNVVDLGPGGYDQVYGYGRLDAFAAVKAIIPVVTMRASALALYVDGPGSSRSTLVASLTDGGSGAALPDQPIEFFADGTSLGWATTDESGVASIPLEGRFRGAGHYFEAVFGGNEHYHGSSDSAQT